MSRPRTLILHAVLTTLVVPLLLSVPAGTAAATAGETTAAATAGETTAGTGRSNVLAWRRIGTSVKGRPIRAFRVGDPEAPVKAVVLGAIHGNEKAGIVLARSLKYGRAIKGVDLWVVPTINPDGVARNRRQNARGVDLNRNWARNWAPLTGSYFSGRKPFSEPETQAFAAFLTEIDPRFVVSLHQPLHGVGRAHERPSFQRRLARGLGLPRKSFNCTGVCHGTMTEWFNHEHTGTAVTVEFGRRPGRYYLRHRAKVGTVRAVLGHW